MDYQKAFDRVKHDKLTEVMEKAGVPELERRLITNLYWRQSAAVKWDGEISRDVKIEKGVRQGCVTPLLCITFAVQPIQRVYDNGSLGK